MQTKARLDERERVRQSALVQVGDWARTREQAKDRGREGGREREGERTRQRDRAWKREAWEERGTGREKVGETDGKMETVRFCICKAT